MIRLSSKYKEFAAPACYEQLITPIEEHMEGKGADKFNYHARKITFEPYFRGMLLFSLTPSQTLTGLQESMGNDPLYEMHGAKMEVSVPALSQANASRPMDAFTEILAEVMAAIHELPGESKILRELDGTTLSSIKDLLVKTQILDSSAFHLPTRIAKWACWGNNNQGGVKIHLKLNAGYGGLEKVVISSSRDHDGKYFRNLLDLEKGNGSIYLYDCGYDKIETFDEITESGNFFVSKLHGSVGYTVLSEEDLGDKTTASGYVVYRKRIVKLGTKENNTLSRNKYVLYDVTDTRGKKGVLVSNMLDEEPDKICALYMYRWTIETCFRWLKHILSLGRFISYSPRGVMMQLLISLIVYGLLVLYQSGKKRFTLTRLLSEIQLDMHCAIYQYGYQQGKLAAQQEQEAGG